MPSRDFFQVAECLLGGELLKTGDEMLGSAHLISVAERINSSQPIAEALFWLRGVFLKQHSRRLPQRLLFQAVAKHLFVWTYLASQLAAAYAKAGVSWYWTSLPTADLAEMVRDVGDTPPDVASNDQQTVSRSRVASGLTCARGGRLGCSGCTSISRSHHSHGTLQTKTCMVARFICLRGSFDAGIKSGSIDQDADPGIKSRVKFERSA